MTIQYLIDKINNSYEHEAIIYKDESFHYQQISHLIMKWESVLNKQDIKQGKIVAIIGDYSPDSIALIIALIINNNIIVPLTPLPQPELKKYFEISKPDFLIHIETQDILLLNKEQNCHEILEYLREQNHPGLILFTSGSTGKPKAVVHDFYKLLTKFEKADKKYRTLCFLMFDHIAGIDTYFYSLYSGGTLILPANRTPLEICRLIENHKVEVLPASPTFLNLLLLSGEYNRFDLSSLKIITFGSEKMPEFLLDRIKNIFKNVRPIQKYGVTEIGSPTSKSKKEDSGWIKIDSDKLNIKIEQGVLYIKSDTAMLGYLNAPSPFTESGWFNTGDIVETDGEYIKILGRESEIINVGGEKVYPSEVEEVIHMMDGVEDVAVKGAESPITGQMVQAFVKLKTNETLSEFRKRMRKFCKDKIANFKIPQKVVLKEDLFYGNRFKKMRNID